MHIFRDQMGFDVKVPASPQRIISLVPSQTELLFDFGLADRIVGVTKFCIHPKEGVNAKTKIGGTKNFNLPLIRQLQPDLIIGNKEENYEDGIAALKSEFPVWMSDIFSVEDALSMIGELGRMTGREQIATSFQERMRKGFEELKPLPPKRALYMIWKNPWMVAGRNTFIHSLMTRTGLANVVHEERYPELSDKRINELEPEIILLSSEPFPFREKHIEELRQICPRSHVLLVDGEMFSWYGSRMLKALPYFEGLRNQLAAIE